MEVISFVLYLVILQPLEDVENGTKKLFKFMVMSESVPSRSVDVDAVLRQVRYDQVVHACSFPPMLYSAPDVHFLSFRVNFWMMVVMERLLQRESRSHLYTHPVAERMKYQNLTERYQN